MTGHALFNEVFLSEIRVGTSDVIGGLNNGWAVANSTLAFERAGLGAGGGGAEGGAFPGAIAGQLGNRAGDHVSAKKRRSTPTANGAASAVGPAAGIKMYVDLAKGNGSINRPSIRQDLMRLHTLHEIGRMGNLRAKAAKAAGQDVPGFGNMAKLSMSEIVRQTRDVGLAILGAQGTLHSYESEGWAAIDEATGNPFIRVVTEAALFAQGPPIYGGTDQIQKNILGERVLGLPKEPNQDKVTPFKDLPKNA
jgi:alkylation response protein AidB-like acyl-CoA dehydrogenase